MFEGLQQRIQERLDATGRSPRAASLASGMGASAIRDIFRRPENSPTLETIRKLAVGLDTTPEWLAYGQGADEVPAAKQAELVPANHSFSLARVDGAVQAGAFLRAEIFDDSRGEVISAPKDPEFPFARQIAYRVNGDSMNMADRPIVDGAFVICADFEDTGLDPADGMIVVVQQTINGGQLRERSVKELRVFDDRTEFHPRSDNPAHEPIIFPKARDADDGREVSILGLVRFVFDNVPLQPIRRKT